MANPDPLPYAYSTGNAFAAFTKFNGKNYFVWRRHMETQLRALGQWEVIDGTIAAPRPVDPDNPTADETRALDAWKLRSARAYAEIALRVDDDYGESISMIDDPHDAWVILERSYGSQQAGIQGVINAELTLMRWDGQTPIHTHHDHMKTLWTRLSAAGLTISEIQFYQHFVNSLPPEFDTVIAIHDPVPSNYSVDVFCERIRAIELRKELRATKEGGTTEDPVALLAKQKGFRGAGRSTVAKGEKSESSGGKPQRIKATCWGCGKRGHYQRDCRSTKKEKGGNIAGSSNANASSSHGASGSTSSNRAAPAKPAGGTILNLMDPCDTAYAAGGIMQYYVDSGATSHYINEVNELHNYTPFESPRDIITPEGTIQAYGSGTLKFIATLNNKEVYGELVDVYYVPDSHTHLISFGRLLSQGWDIRVSRNGLVLQDTKGHLVMDVPMKNYVFPMSLRTVYPSSSLLAYMESGEVTDQYLDERLETLGGDPLVAFSAGEKSEPISLYDWHRRMGHRSMKTIVNMAKGAVTGLVVKDSPAKIPTLDNCPSCALTKAKHFPYKTGRTRATEPLELIHGDIVGPMPVESVSRRRYGLVLMDDYSRASWVLFLRAKSDAPTEFETWVNLVENASQKKIRTVMFDNAKELVAGKMREFCNGHGIRIISSVPYSPSSNGIAERLVGVATDGTRTMLRDSGLPPRFWAEAMNTFMYLRNRTPTAANDGKTPYERFYGMKPDVGHIRTFGCVVKVTLPLEKLGKLEDRAMMGYMLGYKYEGAYRVWVPKMGVQESRNVVFYEGTAPIQPKDGETIEETQGVPAPRTSLPIPTPTALVPETATPAPVEESDEVVEPQPQRERIVIRIPRRPQQRQPSPIEEDDAGEPIPASLRGDETDEAPQYVGRVHQFPTRSTRSGYVRTKVETELYLLSERLKSSSRFLHQRHQLPTHSPFAMR